MQDEEDLIPCPFCGSSDVVLEWQPARLLRKYVNAGHAYARCKKCGATSEMFSSDKIEDDLRPLAREAWNRRSAPRREIEMSTIEEKLDQILRKVG